MLAYCTVLGLAEGNLVYAKGNEPVMSHQIRRADLTIHCHTLGLSPPPAALLADVQRVANTVRKLSLDVAAKPH